jgi:hypothetical protein
MRSRAHTLLRASLTELSFEMPIGIPKRWSRQVSGFCLALSAAACGSTPTSSLAPLAVTVPTPGYPQISRSHVDSHKPQLERLHDFMFVLNGAKPGQPLTARVKRDGKILDLPVTFEERASRKE